ncbi:MAG: PqqD family protein [Pseudomonadota bacterium]
MDFLEKVYEKSDEVVFRKVGEEFILVPIKQSVGDLDSIYTINETGARIWELVDGKTKVKEIKQRIIEEFEVTSDEAERDLIEHLRQLAGIGAIIER